MTDSKKAAAASAAKTPKKPGGRPSQSRGAPKSGSGAVAAWSVRGVPMNVRAKANKAATNLKMPVGDWVAEAIVQFAKSNRNAVSSDVAPAELPPPSPSEIALELAAIRQLLEKREPAAAPQPLEPTGWRHLLRRIAGLLRRQTAELTTAVPTIALTRDGRRIRLNPPTPPPAHKG